MGSLDFDGEKGAFRDFYDKYHDNLNGALDSFKTLIESLLLSMPEVAISSVTGRIKDRDECISKFTRKYQIALEGSKTPYSIREQITDLIGLRVVCLYEDDVERIKEAISEEFDVLDVTDKIAQVEGTEDSFGYKGLHLDLRLNQARMEMAEYRIFSDHPFELQIRTVVQDSWSIIDHKIKYKKSIPNNLRRRINILAALFELSDREFRAIRDATSVELEQTEKPYHEIEEETKAGEDDADFGRENKQEIEPRLYAPLNAFTFLRIARHFFPKFEFEPHQIDSFTQEIVSLKWNISRGKFNYYLRETISDVKQYQAECESTGDKMNPLEIMRHCLYAGNQKVFESILSETARNRFDAWRHGNQR